MLPHLFECPCLLFADTEPQPDYRLFSGGKNAGWKKEYCYAHLVASISKESAYNPTVKVNDAYATRAIGAQRANDPVVGLLQISFSSTVHEVVALGNLERLACVGCPLPASVSSRASEPGNSAFGAVTGPTQNMSLMTNVACNVAMGAWFYYVASMGNGKPSTVTYPDAYCAGSGTGGNVITGLLSHLKGFEGGRGFIANQAGLNALQVLRSGRLPVRDHLYKLTSSRQIPHFCPQGKKLYFRRDELDTWLQRNGQDSSEEIEKQAVNYLIKNKRR